MVILTAIQLIKNAESKVAYITFSANQSIWYVFLTKTILLHDNKGKEANLS